MADTNVPSFVSSLAQPYINFIQGQVEGLTFLPGAAKSNISSLISGSSGASGSSEASGGSGGSESSGGSSAGAGAGAASAAVGAAYAQPYIDYIQGQVEGLTFLPGAARSNISALISGSSSGSGSSGTAASSGGSDTGAGAGAASSAAVGAAYAQPVIDYIREQINGLLPASIAGSITAGFPNASSSSGGSTEPSSVPVGVQNFLVPNAELRAFLSTLGDQSS